MEERKRNPNVAMHDGEWGGHPAVESRKSKHPPLQTKGGAPGFADVEGLGAAGAPGELFESFFDGLGKTNG